MIHERKFKTQIHKQNILWKAIYIYLIFNTFANSWNCLYCTYFQFKIYHGLDMLSTYRRNVRTPRSERGAPPGCSCNTWLSGGSPSRSDSSGRWPGPSLPTLQPVQRNTESEHIHRQPKVKQTTWQRCWFTRKYQNMFCLSLYRDYMINFLISSQLIYISADNKPKVHII